MSMYLCYGCDNLMDSDDGCYESELAKIKETGPLQYQCVCDDCHESEMDKLTEVEQ